MNSKAFPIFLSLGFIVLTYHGLAQDWSNPTEIYSDGSTTLLIQFRDGLRTCDGGPPANYQYIIRGSRKQYDLYVRWSIRYQDCKGKLWYRSEAVNLGGNNVQIGIPIWDRDYTIPALSVKGMPFDVKTFNRFPNQLPSGPLGSSPPDGILGESKSGKDPITLTVSGGSLLNGSEWVWYEGNCGKQKIGTGSSITVRPKINTTYYVRAVGLNDKTDCVSHHVSVQRTSIPPTNVSGKTNICKGDFTQLSVQGGVLGLDANWVWYKGNCDGEKIATGKTIRVEPSSAARYCVRAESPHNQTFPVFVDVKVFEESLPASTITTIADKCANQPVLLEVNGGQLAPDANWVWYKDKCGLNKIGSGEQITIKPQSSDDYFVRAEGNCNVTDCKSTYIRVKELSKEPYSISTSGVSVRGEPIKLEVNGGRTGSDANWVWYSESCGLGKPLGEGKKISITPRKSKTYFVRAEGLCNTTSCVKINLNPRPKHRVHPLYTPKTEDLYWNKFLQVGIGVGIEWSQFSTLATKTQQLFNGQVVNTDESVELNGLGISAEFAFHPYMKDVFGLGLIFRGTVGSSPEILNRSQPTVQSTNYFYSKLDARAVFTLGGRPIKFLCAYRNIIQMHDFREEQVNQDIVIAVDKLQARKEIATAGIRLAPYDRASNRRKRGFNFDLVYHLSRDYPWDWQKFNWSYSQLSDWSHGFGFGFWWHGVLKLQLDAFMFAELGTNTTTKNSKAPHISLSLIYNRNWFY
jgi:hypothetical protein